MCLRVYAPVSMCVGEMIPLIKCMCFYTIPCLAWRQLAPFCCSLPTECNSKLPCERARCQCEWQKQCKYIACITQCILIFCVYVLYMFVCACMCTHVCMCIRISVVNCHLHNHFDTNVKVVANQPGIHHCYCTYTDKTLAF